MFDKTGKGKVKNRKIQLRRAELGCFDYRIHHRPGKLNVVPDSLSRIQVAASTYSCDRADIHKKIRKTAQLMVCDQQIPVKRWQNVLPDALHAVGSLLCTSTNSTPHESFFRF